jgi:hypothetical protein
MVAYWFHRKAVGTTHKAVVITLKAVMITRKAVVITLKAVVITLKAVVITHKAVGITLLAVIDDKASALFDARAVFVDEIENVELCDGLGGDARPYIPRAREHRRLVCVECCCL